MTEMDADRRARWRDVDEGAPLTWDLWAAEVAHAEVLTPAGVAAVTEAIDIIAGFLGSDWLGKFLPAKPGADALPLLSLRWWPINSARATFERLLTLGARLRVLEGTPGLVPIRTAIRGSLGNFEHALLQLEVGALAIRDGWTVVFEPRPVADGTRVTDLLLTRELDRMLVEVKGFQLGAITRADMVLGDLVTRAQIALEVEYQVYFSGSIETPRSAPVLQEWLDDLAGVAAEVAGDEQPRISRPPFGGELQILPGLPPEGTERSMPIRQRDEWAWISSQIDKKAEQGRGTDPLWLRFEETGPFWSISHPREQHSEWLETVGLWLEQQLARYPHVAGLVLSGPDQSIASTVIRQEHLLVASTSVSIACTTNQPWWRETLIVAGPHEAALEQAGAWYRFYMNEDTWLTWAHEVLGLAPLGNLFNERG